jgi:DNA polymerase elongation subunit (family B)
VKILVIDIETRPHLAYVWSLWDQGVNLDRLIETGEIISWAAKWVGEKNVEFSSIHHDGRKKMVKRAWELLNEADVVMTYNGKKFDVPHLQRAFLEEGLTPPAPYAQIDLYWTVRSQFNFPSNKLQYAAERLLGVGKTPGTGFGLWVKCLEGDEKAWAKMKKYNINDVVITEQLYEKIRPWIRSHPSYAAFRGEDVCPKCDSVNLTRQGYTTLTTGRYQRYQCKDCGSWCRSTKRFDKTTVTQSANS